MSITIDRGKDKDKYKNNNNNKDKDTVKTIPPETTERGSGGVL